MSSPLLRRSLQLIEDGPAADTLSDALVRDEKALGPDRPQVGALLELRATIMSRHDEAPPAREDLERARVVMCSHFGPRSLAVAGVLADLGDVGQDAKQFSVAVTQYGLALQMVRESASSNPKP